MFPTVATNGQQQHTADTHTSLADIVRQETQDGRLIVRFLVSAMQGHVVGAKPCHRLDAARLLIRLGHDAAGAFVAANTRAPHPTAPSPAPSNGARPAPDQQLAEIVRQETSNGRDAVRFLVDVMHGRLPGFKPRHRLYAAKELLHRLSAIEVEAGDPDDAPETLDRSDHHPNGQTTTTPRHSRESGSPGGTAQPADQADDRHDEDVPGPNVSYDTYGYDDYCRDAGGRKALLRIFGSEQAVKAANRAAREYRLTHSRPEAGPAPEDEPYGFRAVLYIYGGSRGRHGRLQSRHGIPQEERADRDPRPPVRRRRRRPAPRRPPL